jgi:O-antigen/teichoic acid export membrane protein
VISTFAAITKKLKSKIVNPMAGDFGQTLRHFGNYFGANIATKALGFVSIPVLTRLLVPEEYGITNVFLGLVSIVLPLFTLNAYSAVGRYYYEETEDFPAFFGTTVLVTAGFVALSSLIFMIYRAFFASLMGLPVGIVALVVPLTIFQVSTSFFEQIYQPQKESRKIALRQIIQSYSTFGVAVAIILLLNSEKYRGMIYSHILVGAGFFVYYVFQLRMYFRLSLKGRAIAYILRYSLPLLPYMLSSTILLQFDRIVVNRFVGASGAGLYSLAANIGMLLAVLANSLYAAWIPDYFRFMNVGEFKAIDRNVDRLFRVVVLGAVGLMYFGREIGMVLAARSYHSSLGVVPLIVVAHLFGAIFPIYGWAFGYVKRTYFLSAIVLGAGSANVVLNSLLVRRVGYYGAAYAMVCSYFLMAAAAWFVNKIVLRMYCPRLWIILRWMFVALGFLGIYYGVRSLGLALLAEVAIKAALMLILATVILLRRSEAP